jgi:hypothetical protein
LYEEKTPSPHTIHLLDAQGSTVLTSLQIACCLRPGRLSLSPFALSRLLSLACTPSLALARLHSLACSRSLSLVPLVPAKVCHMAKRRVGYSTRRHMLEPVLLEAVLPDRALYLPTFSHFLIVNKTALYLSLSLARSFSFSLLSLFSAVQWGKKLMDTPFTSFRYLNPTSTTPRRFFLLLRAWRSRASSVHVVDCVCFPPPASPPPPR